MLEISKSLFDDFFFYQYRQEFSQLELYQEVKGINILSKKSIVREDLQILIHQEVEKIKNEIKNLLLSNINNTAYQMDEKLSFQLSVLTNPRPFKSKIIKTDHWIKLFYYYLFDFIDFPLFSIWMNQHPLSKELKLIDDNVNYIDKYGRKYKNPIVKANDLESFWKIKIPPTILDQIFYYPILSENIENIENELKKDKYPYLKIDLQSQVNEKKDKIHLFECFSVFFSQPLLFIDSWRDSENVIDLSK
jgi:hypothetical protein